jgi:hypothetical protein
VTVIKVLVLRHTHDLSTECSTVEELISINRIEFDVLSHQFSRAMKHLNAVRILEKSRNPFPIFEAYGSQRREYIALSPEIYMETALHIVIREAILRRSSRFPQ